MIEKISNILVIRLSSMGDVVLTTAFVRQLKKKYPESSIHFVTAKPFVEIYKYNPYIYNLIEYDKSASIQDIALLKQNIKKDLPDEKFDVVIDLQRNLRTKIFRSGLGKRYFYIHKRRLHKLSLVYMKKPLLKNILPIPEIYRLTAAELRIQDDKKGLELWFENEKTLNVYPPDNPEYLNERINNRIAIAPGAFHFTKRFPVEKFIILIKQLIIDFNAEIILIGGTKDTEITEQIKSSMNQNIVDHSGSQSILTTASALDTCSLLITNDTGVMHLAAARKVPVVAIFGSTVTEFGFIPYRTKNEIIEKDLPCRPCTHIGRDKCPKGHFKCMNDIEINEIMDAVRRTMNI